MKYLDYFVILNLIAYCSILYFPIFDNFMKIFFGIINAICLYGYLVDLYDNKFSRYVVITYNKDKDTVKIHKKIFSLSNARKYKYEIERNFYNQQISYWRLKNGNNNFVSNRDVYILKI